MKTEFIEKTEFLRRYMIGAAVIAALVDATVVFLQAPVEAIGAEGVASKVVVSSVFALLAFTLRFVTLLFNVFKTKGNDNDRNLLVKAVSILNAIMLLAVLEPWAAGSLGVGVFLFVFPCTQALVEIALGKVWRLNREKVGRFEGLEGEKVRRFEGEKVGRFEGLLYEGSILDHVQPTPIKRGDSGLGKGVLDVLREMEDDKNPLLAN